MMKLFSIIPYWLNSKTGETRVNKKWIFLKVGQTLTEVQEWAKNNKGEIYFRPDDVYRPEDIDESNLKFDVSVKELKEGFVSDTNDTEYKIAYDLISKIEIKRIEIPINHGNQE